MVFSLKIAAVHGGLEQTDQFPVCEFLHRVNKYVGHVAKAGAGSGVDWLCLHCRQMIDFWTVWCLDGYLTKPC